MRKGWPADSMKPTSHPPQSGRSKVCTASPSWNVPAGLLKSGNIGPHLKADRGCLCWRGRHSHICSLFSLPLCITPPLPNIPMLVFFSSYAQIHICSEAQENTNLYFLSHCSVTPVRPSVTSIGMYCLGYLQYAIPALFLDVSNA